MFHDWENFYLIVGGGAGALIGTMFIVATLTAGFDTARRIELGRRIYISPVVFHLSLVLVVSAIAVAPDLPAEAVSILVGLCAAVGLAYAAFVTIRMFRGELPNTPDVSDRWFYGFFPLLVYVGLVIAAIAARSVEREAAFGIAAAMLTLLLIGIRNAWDLATFMVQHIAERNDTAKPGP